ncbi:MAG: DNA replication and repair protein RecF [Oligoflexia bacterium]|nr:DNA replication and repair protein RecF [Oligoflexia bacterium]
MGSYKILKFRVKNFRNLEAQNLEFSSKINLIIGNNGNGKTNLLEAIHLLASKKSFRKNCTYSHFSSVNGTQDGDNSRIYFFSLLKEDVCDIQTQFNCQIDIEKTERTYSLNGKIVKKAPNIITLYVSPFDAHLFYLIPKVRRDFFDHYLGILNSEYKRGLSKYFSLIKNRNRLIALMKSRAGDNNKQIIAVDRELAKYIPEIVRERELFLKNLKTIYTKVAKDIFANDVDINIILDSKFKSKEEDEVFELMQENLLEDMRSGITRNCIHRDNYSISFNGLSSEGFASTGQQRLCYLSLLFAYIELFRGKFLASPILLLDDISTELDKAKLNGLIKYLINGNSQAFITTTNENFGYHLEKSESQISKKFKLEAGHVSLVNELV